MRQLFEFSKSQAKTLTWLGIIVVIGGSYLLVRDYYLPPTDNRHPWREQGLDDYRPPLELDVNFSPADSLELIPGIGPVLAGRIVEYRREQSGLITVDSLINVSGIGPVTLKKIKKYFRIYER